MITTPQRIDHTVAIGEAASQLLSQGANPIIRYRFTADPAESIAFSYSPLLEAVLSLHVLSQPKHHPLQHPWVRRARSLPPELRREIAAFRFAYDGFVPEFLMPSPASPFRSFDEDLRELEQLDDSTLALGFLRPLYDHQGERDETLLADPAVREHVLARADPELAALIFENPRELVERFAALLASYWEAAFEEEWQALEPRLAETVHEAGRRIAGDGVYGYLTALSPQLLIDPSRREIRRDLPHEHTVEVGPRSELVLVPSAFVWPHVRVNCDPPWPPAIAVPGAVRAGGRQVEAPLRGRRPRAARACRRDPPARPEADRRRRALDPGAGAPDRDQRGRPLEAPAPARPGRSRPGSSRWVLRALQPGAGADRDPFRGRAALSAGDGVRTS
jgi:hypothetical protein